MQHIIIYKCILFNYKLYNLYMCIFDILLDIYCYKMPYIIEILLNKKHINNSVVMIGFWIIMLFYFIFLLNIPKSPQPYIGYLIITYLADMYHMQPSFSSENIAGNKPGAKEFSF